MKSNIYICRKLLNGKDIEEWAKSVGFKSMLPLEDLHVTQVYCKDTVDWDLIDKDQPEVLLNKFDDDRSVEQFDGGACVLEFKSEYLIARYDELAKDGIKSSYPDYRSHITITYECSDDLDIENIEPYKGILVFGPEIYKPLNHDWKDDMKEIVLSESVSENDWDRLYDIFSKSYIEATGTSWSKEKFLSRAKNWTFYGDDAGFVAFREQASGYRKLVGVAGSLSGILKGMRRLNEENKPTWGAVSDKLAKASSKFGFIAPHLYTGGPLVLKLIFKLIPASVFGGTSPKISSDGGVEMDYDDIGSVKKYFIANKPYYEKLITDSNAAKYLDNPLVKMFFRKIIGLNVD